MDKRNTYSNIILIIKKIYILRRRSILGFNIPPPSRQPTGISLLPVHKGWGILSLPSWGREFELEVSSIFSGIQVLDLWILRFLRQIVYLCEQTTKKKGLQGLGFNTRSMSRKSWMLISPFTKKNWVGHLNKIFAPGDKGAEIWTNQS